MLSKYQWQRSVILYLIIMTVEIIFAAQILMKLWSCSERNVFQQKERTISAVFSLFMQIVEQR